MMDRVCAIRLRARKKARKRGDGIAGKYIFRVGRNHYFFFATVRLSHKRITGLAIKIVE